MPACVIVALCEPWANVCRRQVVYNNTCVLMHVQHMSYKDSQMMTLVLKFRAHPCRKSLSEVVNKEIFHLVGVAWWQYLEHTANTRLCKAC